MRIQGAPEHRSESEACLTPEDGAHGVPIPGSTVVLVIDDEEPFLNQFRRLLEREGLPVLTVCLKERSFDKVDQILRQFDVKVAVIDLDMPISGTQVKAALLQISRETKVVFCTGKTVELAERAASAMREGPSDFIFKPLDLEGAGLRIRKLFDEVQTDDMVVSSYANRPQDFESGPLRLIEEAVGELHEAIGERLAQPGWLTEEKRTQALNALERLRLLTHGLSSAMGEGEPFANFLAAVAEKDAPRALSLLQLVEEIGAEILEYRPDASRDVTLTTSIPMDLKIETVRPLFAEALSPLLTNALEASGDGGTVEVSAEEQEGRVKITVSDAGLHPIQDVDAIFRPYYTTKVKDGKGPIHVGLGLNRAELAAEYLGGRIRCVVSRRGRTTFELSLPVRMKRSSSGEDPR